MPQPDSMNDVPPKLHFDEDNDGKLEGPFSEKP